MANSHSIQFLSASGQYGSIGDNPALSITGDLTIESWFKMFSLPTAVDFAIVSKYAGTTQHAYFLTINATNKNFILEYFEDGDSKVTRLTSDATVTSADINRWIHVALTVDVSGKTGIYYINGVAGGVTVTEGGGGATSIKDTTAGFTVGAFSSDDPRLFFNGLMDEVRIFDDIRTANEIASNFNLETTDTGNLVAYYKFNGDATDSAGSNNLTLNGSPTYSRDIPFGLLQSGLV